MLFLLVLSACSAAVLADDVAKEPAIVTFGTFQNFTIRPAEFEPVDKDEKCESGKFQGNRYMKDNDPTIILIYDVAGNFVGSQVGLFKEEVDAAVLPEDWRKWFDKNPQIEADVINEKEVYLMTIYKQDPETVCNTSDSRVNDHLYVRDNGIYTAIDRKNEGSLTDSRYAKNVCQDKMGTHYFGEMSGTDCKDVTPSFVLVDGGNVIAHGWVFPGVYKSTNLEPCPRDLLELIFPPQGDCFLDGFDNAKGMTTQHFYYTNDYESITCKKE